MEQSRQGLSSKIHSALIPILSVVTALILGALITLFSGGDPILAYKGLWEGAFGSWDSLSETIVWATPYILAGLAVAIGFKGGLFNIGAEGQITAGALVSVWIGYSVTFLPGFIHVSLAILMGCLAGAIWGAIPGYLKAKTGAHEVINTIMMNYIALYLSNYLLAGPMKDPDPLNPVAQTPKIAISARLPQIFPPFRVHWGCILAVLVAIFIFWLLWKTTIGFEIRTVGLSPSAARYAGINISRNIILTMGISGFLAGMAGAIEVMGLNYYHMPGFNVGYGFDSIAIALLGKSHPIGVIPAAFLFGALRNGATRMQFLSQISVDVISVIQGLVLIFVAADEIIRWLYRIKLPTLNSSPSTGEGRRG